MAEVFDGAPALRSVFRSRQSCSYSAGVGVISIQGFPVVGVDFALPFFICLSQRGTSCAPETCRNARSIAAPFEGGRGADPLGPPNTRGRSEQDCEAGQSSSGTMLALPRLCPGFAQAQLRRSPGSARPLPGLRRLQARALRSHAAPKPGHSRRERCFAGASAFVSAYKSKPRGKSGGQLPGQLAPTRARRKRLLVAQLLRATCEGEGASSAADAIRLERATICGDR